MYEKPRLYVCLLRLYVYISDFISEIESMYSPVYALYNFDE